MHHVTPSGEPGIGKSRLTAALMERLAAEPHTRLRYFCSPQHTDSAFYPIISQMERAAGPVRDDTPQARLDKLDAVLAQTLTSKQDAALFVEMLSLPNDGRYPALDLTPHQRRQKTLEALSAQLMALAQQRPALMIFEDVHWIDPTSLEALGRTVDRLGTLRVLLIVTYRSEFEPPWLGRPNVTALTLNRLGEREIATLIDRVTGNKLLTTSIRQNIIERTDGIPLFVEEMTKTVLEAGERAVEAAVAAIPSPTIAVPASLHASLMARLDRLGPAKQVAQIGAVIGREFSFSLINRVARWQEEDLATALDRLVSAGLLFRQGVWPHATYLFKHALVQDTAYSTLLREPRRALHARIAKILENQFPEIAESQPELLARHCTEAGLTEDAVRLWGKAAELSLKRSALVEAMVQLTRALELIATLPGTPALRREQIRLQVALINPLFYVKGPAAPQTKLAVERARSLIEHAEALGEPQEDPLLLFLVLNGTWAASFVAMQGEVLRELATQYMAVAERNGAKTPLMYGHRTMGISLTVMGDIAQGRAHLDRTIELYDPIAHRALATRFGQDVGVAILSFRSLARWLLGFPEAALADVDRALKDAREIGHTATLMYGLAMTSITLINCGSYASATSQLDELVTLAGETGAVLWKAVGTVLQGCLLALTGPASNAVQIISAGLSAWRSTGSKLFVPFFCSSLAKAYANLAQFDHASYWIGEAVSVLQTSRENWCEADLIRVAGEIALKSPEQNAGAEAHFERALAVARQQQAKSWELRAAMSMAQLWRDQGKPQQARNLLAPVYGWFTEGFDTLDLKEAKTLLDELAS